VNSVAPEIEPVWNLALAYFFNLLHYAAAGSATQIGRLAGRSSVWVRRADTQLLL
jgi:hypothetical protein